VGGRGRSKKSAEDAEVGAVVWVVLAVDDDCGRCCCCCCCWEGDGGGGCFFLRTSTRSRMELTRPCCVCGEDGGSVIDKREIMT